MTDHEHQDNSSSVDTDLGRAIVEQKLATAEEVGKCLDAQATMANPSNETSLARVLIDNGVVTANQVKRVRRMIEESRGQRIPGYRIESKLGSGAMATVFKATQLSLARTVAVKVLPRRLSENPEYVERFYSEGKAAARLNHPNIVQAIDVGEAGGYHYFVMEYVEGHTLYDEIAAGKIFSEVEAAKVVIQVARALEHAHGLGLIHRDVKPKNIMITDDGVAKLADMGLAREVSDAKLAQAEAGRAYGTPHYISPEQIRGEVDIDFRADIYALGGTLYHLVTGRVPFEGPTPAAVMHKHLKEPLVPPDHIRTELSWGLGEVVEVMMAKNRRGRYASTSDLIVDLEAIAAGEPPPLARKHIDAGVLEAMASETAVPPVGTHVGGWPVGSESMMNIIIALVAALALSLIVNLLQALM